MLEKGGESFPLTASKGEWRMKRWEVHPNGEGAGKLSYPLLSLNIPSPGATYQCSGRARDDIATEPQEGSRSPYTQWSEVREMHFLMRPASVKLEILTYSMFYKTNGERKE